MRSSVSLTSAARLQAIIIACLFCVSEQFDFGRHVSRTYVFPFAMLVCVVQEAQQLVRAQQHELEEARRDNMRLQVIGTHSLAAVLTVMPAGACAKLCLLDGAMGACNHAWWSLHAGMYLQQQ